MISRWRGIVEVLACGSVHVKRYIGRFLSCRRYDQFFSNNFCTGNRLLRKRSIGFKNERYCFVQVRASLFKRFSLSVCARQFLNECGIASGTLMKTAVS
jgi:hypothetical protein